MAANQIVPVASNPVSRSLLTNESKLAMRNFLEISEASTNAYSFNTNQFGVVTSNVVIKTGADITNLLNSGTGFTFADSTARQGSLNNLAGTSGMTTGDLLRFDGSNLTRFGRGQDGMTLATMAGTLYWGKWNTADFAGTPTGTISVPPIPGTAITNGLGQWLIADSIGVSNTAAVSGRWADLSGYGNHATNSGGLTYRQNAALGHASVYYDGVNGLTDLGRWFTNWTAAEIFVVLRTANDPATRDTKSGLWTLGTPTATINKYPKTSDSIIYENFASTAVKTLVNPTTALNSVHVYNVVVDAGSMVNSINGTNLMGGQAVTLGYPTNGYFGVSHDNTYAAGNTYNGELFELMIYTNAVLSPGQRQQNVAYLMAKYGIPPPFTTNFPVQGGLAFRVPALALTNTVGGSAVSNAFDISGNRLHMTLNTAGVTYETNAWGDLPTMRFNGTGFLSGGTPPDLTTFTVAIVWNATSDAGGGYGGPFGFSASGQNGFSVVSEDGSAANYRSHLTVFNTSTEAANLTIPTEGLNLSQAQRGKKVDIWRYNGASGAMWVNGVAKAVSSGGATYARSFTLGKAYATVACDIAEVAVWSRALSDQEVAAMVSFYDALYHTAATPYVPSGSQANGFTGGDLSAVPAGSVIYQGAGALTGTTNLYWVAADSRLRLGIPSAGSNEKLWDIALGATSLDIRTRNDADNAYITAIGITRSGTTPIALQLAGDISASGSITSGAINAADNISFTAAGRGIRFKEGINARAGVSTLVGGTVTVNNTGVTANTRAQLTHKVAGGTLGILSLGTVTASTSFVINSSSGTDTSDVFWILYEPAP